MMDESGWELRMAKRMKAPNNLKPVGGYFVGQCFDWSPHPRCENSIGCSGLAEEDYSLHHSHDTYIVTGPSVLMELNSSSHVPSYSNYNW